MSEQWKEEPNCCGNLTFFSVGFASSHPVSASATHMLVCLVHEECALEQQIRIMQKPNAKVLLRFRCDHWNGRFVFLVTKYLPVFTIILFESPFVSGLAQTHRQTDAKPKRICTTNIASWYCSRSSCCYRAASVNFFFAPFLCRSCLLCALFHRGHDERVSCSCWIPLFIE